MQNGGEKLDFLLIALGEGFDLRVAILGDLKALGPFVQVLASNSHPYPMQTRQEEQLFFYLYLWVQSPLFWQIAPVAARHFAYICAIPGDATTIRTKNVKNHAHGGGFSRTVSSQEAKDRAFSHFHRQVFDNVDLGKGLVYMFDDQSHDDGSSL